MPDYPGIRINNTAVFAGNTKSLSLTITNSSVSQGISKSFGRLIQTTIVINGLSKSIGRLIFNNFRNYLSPNKAYFNNAFSQESTKIYLNKSALGLPTGLNLSYEAFLIALIIQWANNIGLGSEAKIQAQWLSYGDLDDGYLYFNIQIIFKKAVNVIDDYEIQPDYTISPLDF